MPRNGSGVYSQPFDDVDADTTIESAVYNGFTRDVEADLNAKRPIIAGGTGADDAAEARANLKAEVAQQLVTNFDSHVWENGSFFAAGSATASPVAGHEYAGIAYKGGSEDYIIVEARDLNDTTNAGILYIRYKIGGAWLPWSIDGEDQFVQLTGDTMSGNLIIQGTWPTLVLDKDLAASACAIQSKSNAVARWTMHLGNEATETAGNAGSNFALYSHDNGGIARECLAIERDSNRAHFYGDIIIKNGGSNSGVLRFGNQENNYLYWDGAKYTLNGQAGHTELDVNGPVSVNESINLNTAGGNAHIWFHQPGVGNRWVQYYSASTGHLIFQEEFTTHAQFTMNADGRLYLPQGIVTTTNNITAGPTYTHNVAYSNPTWGDMSIQAVHVSGVRVGWTLNVASTQFRFENGGLAAKPGGGAWADTSDLRIKNVVGEYKSGLDAVAKLEPVRFTYKGNDTSGPPDHYPPGAKDTPAKKGAPAVPYPNSTHYQMAVAQTEYIGLIAQATEAVMPELVSQSKGYINGVEVQDLRSLDTTPLIFALINAVKELKARVEQLESTP